ncbi:MAG: 5-bromo-4-chloroindolyl phosphate hydrolysis family protein [Oscillospiraceae bacterium]|nr:5-bromo-4-chloroindolyl phosphate hydrolysis family protein [Oscillospiraceae bacterium]
MNDNERNNGEILDEQSGNKIVNAEKKSVVPIISFGICFVLLALITRLRNPTTLVLVTAFSFVMYQIVKSKFPPKKIEICMENIQDPAYTGQGADKEAKPEASPELKDLNERIDLYFIELKLLGDSIDDKLISGDIAEIEETLKKIQVQLNDETKPGNSRRITQVTDFFDYYMPATIKILNSYRKIESQNLTGENASETKKRVEESLPFIKKAFAKELDNMFSDEMIDITTDIDVLESMLSKDGLLNRDNIKNFEI